MCFGYRAVRTLDPRGDVTRGDRVIEAAEAVTIRRIFQLFADSNSPIAIAKLLNAEGVAGPQGHTWRDTTIRGHAARRTGIIRNELYVGRQVWNRMHFMKDPATGKRVSRMNPPSAWVTHDLPELRIVDDAVWDRVQQRLVGIREASGANVTGRPRYWEARRSQNLLTGKIFCGACGGAVSAVGKDLLACTAARRQGICDNRRGIRRPVLDKLILDALRAQLMQPDDLAAFVSEFTAEWNRLQAKASAMSGSRQRELETVERKLGALVGAITDGLRGTSLQQKLNDLERRKSELEQNLAATPRPRPAMHPNLSEVYRAKVADLHKALIDTTGGVAALEAVRSLIDQVVLHPSADGKGLEIKLTGEIAAMIDLALGRSGSQISAADHDLFSRSVKVVAGIGFEPMTFRL